MRYRRYTINQLARLRNKLADAPIAEEVAKSDKVAEESDKPETETPRKEGTNVANVPSA